MNQKAREFKDAMKFWKRKARDAEQKLAVADFANDAASAVTTMPSGTPADDELRLKCVFARDWPGVGLHTLFSREGGLEV